MGNVFTSCIKPKNKLKTNYKPSVKLDSTISHTSQHDYQEKLKEILDDIFKTILSSSALNNSVYVARTNCKRPISQSEEGESPPKLQRVDDIQFFTDIYSIEELEDFLSICSNSNSPMSLLENDDEDQSRSLHDKVLLGSIKDIDSLTKTEIENLLKYDKIHLKLAENEEYLKKLTAILTKATRNHILEDILDLTNEEGNSAVCIAALNHNTKGFYYLIFKCNSKIPVFISIKNQKIPFLIYLAKHGKIKHKNNENNQVAYILYEVLKQIIDIYQKQDLLEHLCAIDESTKLSLPHFLLNIYNTSKDLRHQIVECFKLCIKECPECADVMCINYYDPRYKLNLMANTLSNPDINVELNKEFMDHLRLRMFDDDKELLRHLVKVHQDKDKRERLLKIID